MIKITEWQCDICGRRYTSKGLAKECEENGAAVEYPIGTIYGNHEKGAFYENITFAVATNDTKNHINTGGSWACRDTGYGDSLGESMCGGNSLNLNDYDAKLDFEHPTFKRMVEYLKSQGIPIYIWDGKNPVLYSGQPKLKEKKKNG